MVSDRRSLLGLSCVVSLSQLRFLALHFCLILLLKRESILLRLLSEFLLHLFYHALLRLHDFASLVLCLFSFLSFFLDYLLIFFVELGSLGQLLHQDVLLLLLLLMFGDNDSFQVGDLLP